MEDQVTKACLIANMKRSVELLEKGKLDPYCDLPELETKLKETRRDSIRFVNSVRKKTSWWRYEE